MQHRSICETLEDRSLMSVSVGSDGWTDITPSSDSKLIYVSSSSGSDSNPGTQSAPVKSIAKGISMMRSGMPDHVRLKRGDSWTENLGWAKSGRSSQEPAVMEAYGTGARPVIKAGSGTAIQVASGNVNNVAFTGIKLYAHTRDPNAPGFSRSEGGYGIRFVAGTTGVLVEDMEIDQFLFGMLFQDFNGPQSNVKIRRSVITDSYSIYKAHSSGIYAHGVNGLTLEENVWDHNGWNSQVSGGDATGQNHNAYLTERTTNVVVKGNIFADGSSHGLQARAGGEIRDNLFLRNPIAMSYGLVNGAALKAGGVTGVVDGNVILDGRNIGNTPRGTAMEIGNVKSATISNNIISDNSKSQNAAIALGTGGDLLNAGSGVGINNLVIEDNVVNKWSRMFEVSSAFNIGGSGYTGLNNLTVRSNDFQNSIDRYGAIVWQSDAANKGEEFFSGNRYYDETADKNWFVIGGSLNTLSSYQSKLEPTAQAVKVNYKNPNANIASYAGSYESFMSEARKASSSNWRTTYTAKGAIAYMRGAFNMSATTSPVTPPAVQQPPATSGTSDTTLPKLTSYSASASSIALTFDENVGNSLIASDLSITNTSTGKSIAASATSLSYNSSNNVATWTFPGLSGGKLPSGSYRLLLPDQNIADAAGNRLGGGKDWSATVTITSSVTSGSTTSGSTTSGSTTSGSSSSDTTNPMLVSRSANSTSASFKFTENVSTSVLSSDLWIKNAKTGASITGLKVSYDYNSNTATWTYPKLASGTYNFTLPDQNILDAAGNRLGGGSDIRFTLTV